MNVISVEDVSKSYGEKVLLNKVTLNLDDNDKVGLIGVNGTGKTTLLNIITGNDSPDSGVIKKPQGVNIEYLSQNPRFEADVNVLEQVLGGDLPVMKTIADYEQLLADMSIDPDNPKLQKRFLRLTSDMNSIDAWHLESRVKTILSKLGIRKFGAKMGTLSGGGRKRVALARVLIAPCDLLILDEPTNHMDNRTIDWLEKYLENRKGALLMITHDRYFLDRVVNKIIELDHGNLYTYNGNYAQYLEEKSARISMQSAIENRRKSLYKKELEWIRKGAKARSTKQKARIKRFEQLKKSAINIDEAKLDISVGKSRLGKKVIDINNIAVNFGNKNIIKDFSCILLRDDRIGIIGDNGVGKSTLLNTIAGKLRPDCGNVDIGTTVKLAYLSQESEYMDPNLRAIEYIKKEAEYITTANGIKLSAAQMMEKFLFPRDMQWVHISALSGGEKRRLYLLRILMTVPNVLLLDEPTNDLDIDTLKVLEEYINEFDGAVISVSHDRYFLDKTCHRILAFEGQGRIVENTGNYSDYLENTAAIGEDSKKTINEDKPKNVKLKPKTIKMTYKEKQEYDTIDADIAALENKITELDDTISAIASDYIKLQELLNEKEILEDELLFKLERQEYLMNLQEQINNAKLN